MLTEAGQVSSAAQACPLPATPWAAARQASLSITTSWSLLKLMSIELVLEFGLWNAGGRGGKLVMGTRL